MENGDLVQPVRPSNSRNVIVAVIITAVLVAGLTFAVVKFWPTRTSTVADQNTNPPISQTDINTAAANQTQDSNALTGDKILNKLVNVEFQLEMQTMGIHLDQYIVDPNNPMRYYFIGLNGENPNFEVYDFAKDKSYPKTGDIDVQSTSQILFSDALPKSSKDVSYQFRLAGLENNMFIYYPDGDDDSPGPCADPLLSSYTLYAFDVSDAKPTKKPYTVPDDVKKAHEAAYNECAKNIGG